MIKTVTVRNLVLGDGTPKICVPVVAEDLPGLEASLLALTGVRYDLAEFRADHYRGSHEQALRLIRSSVGDCPLLFTVRTGAEGGEAFIDPAAYEEQLLSAAKCGLADLIDVELFTAGDRAAALVGQLHALGMSVVGSSHDFEKTPSAQEMTGRLLRMQQADMDITKLAVMPRSRQDVLRLLDVTCQMADGLADRPFITMSMGSLGAVSRICGGLTGSAVTFASAGRASAPGQISAVSMRTILNVLGSSFV